MPPIRGLEPLSDVPYEFISREQFRDDLIELQFSEIPEEWRHAEERLLKRLGLLPDDADLDQLLVDLYGAQVAAFYRPDTKRFYIIQRDQPFGPTDGSSSLTSTPTRSRTSTSTSRATRVKDLAEGDAALGQLAAVEGDATLTMQQWTIENLSPEEVLQILLESIGQLDDPVAREHAAHPAPSARVPVRRGLRVHRGALQHWRLRRGQRDAQRGHPGLDRADPPSREVPRERGAQVLSPWTSCQLGDGWRRVYEQTMGELLMQVLAAGGEPPRRRSLAFRSSGHTPKPLRAGVATAS